MQSLYLKTVVRQHNKVLQLKLLQVACDWLLKGQGEAKLKTGLNGGQEHKCVEVLKRVAEDSRAGLSELDISQW